MCIRDRFGEEMLHAFGRLVDLLERYPLRGLQGAIGTDLDQLTLLQGDREKLAQLNIEFLSHFGVSRGLNAIGQIYPRSIDFEVTSTLYQLGSGISNWAKTLRLMAGGEMVTEGFAKGQVGSSAMPHKKNPILTENLTGLSRMVRSYVLPALENIALWHERDISHSSVERNIGPDANITIDFALVRLTNI